MKQKHLEIIEECLALGANHFVLASAFMSLIGCFGETEPRMILWLVMLALPLFFYYLRKTSKNFLLFFLLHIIWPFIAIAITLENFTMCTMYFLLATTYVIWSFKIKIKDKDKPVEAATALLAVVVFSVGMIMQMIWGVPGWTNYYMIFVFAYFACYYLWLYLNKYHKFMLYNKNSTSNIPEKEIFTAGMTQTMAYTIGGLGILFFSANLGWFERIAGVAGDIFMAFLRFVISNIHISYDTDHGVLIDENIAEDSGPLPTPVEGQSEFFNELVLMLIKIFTVIAILVAIYAIIKGFRTMWKKFAENKLSEEMMMAQNEIRENLTIDKDERDKKERNLFGFMDNKEKIRKFYRKRVLKDKVAIAGGLDAERLNCMTAKECCDKIAADKLQEMYNKVRYSAEEISSEDVRLAKSDRNNR